MKLFIKFEDLEQLEFDDVDIGDNPVSGVASIHLVGKSKVTKLKQIAPIDVEKMNSLNEFIDSVCSESRLNQGLDKLKENNLDHTDNKNIGEYIKWVVNDIFKEESDTIIANQFESKKIGSLVANKARQFYLNQPI